MGIRKRLLYLNECYQKEAKEILMEEYPNLYFYVSPSGHITTWVKVNGSDGSAVNQEGLLADVGLFSPEDFEKINEKAELASTQPDKYFFCSECNKSLPKEQFGACVMASTYCKECSEIPAIKRVIDMSRESGFYD